MNSKPFFRMSQDETNENNDGEAYYSCSEIEGAVTLIHSGISMCGHMHSTTKGMPYICDYKGGDLPKDEIIQARDSLREKNQTNEDTPCKGCQFLQKRKWPKREYLVDHVTVGHYSLCNLRCTYCYITDYTVDERKLYFNPPYDASVSIKSLITMDLLDPNSTAWLTAGEPTLFDKFDEITEQLLDKGVKITIGTNCTKPHEVIKRGLKENLMEILCSVDSGSREKFKEIKGRDRHDAVWRVLKEYSEINQAAVVVKYIFMDENNSESEVNTFIDLCVQNNIGQISISRDILKYRGVLSQQKDDMPDSMIRAMALMMYGAIYNNMEVYFDVNWPVFEDAEIRRIKVAALNLMDEHGYNRSEELTKHYFEERTSTSSLIVGGQQ